MGWWRADRWYFAVGGVPVKAAGPSPVNPARAAAALAIFESSFGSNEAARLLMASSPCLASTSRPGAPVDHAQLISISGLVRLEVRILSASSVRPAAW
jgi:hypothetical protein